MAPDDGRNGKSAGWAQRPRCPCSSLLPRMESTVRDAGAARPEAHPETVGFGGLGAKLNWLRAGVLGANDGVVSGAGITIGVAAADPANLHAIMLAGVAGLLAGASAMAMGSPMRCAEAVKIPSSSSKSRRRDGPKPGCSASRGRVWPLGRITGLPLATTVDARP